MKEIVVYKGGDVVANIPIYNSYQTPSEVYLLTDIPFEVRERIVKYATGNSNVVTYKEYRWGWKSTNGDD